MRVRIFPTRQRLAGALAADIARAVRQHPSLVLGLPTGRTPVLFYRGLVALYRSRQIDLSQAITFNLDEFVGVGAADPRSYHAFMRRHLFDHVNLSRRRTHLLNGSAPDLDGECERYEQAIARAGGIDVQILGLGANGHIGFNEPGRSLVATTHRARLREASRRANRGLFGNRLRAVPRDALSMGVGTILRARRIVLIATGATKARSVARMIQGPVTPRLPASFLQLHPHAEAWLDRAAASRL